MEIYHGNALTASDLDHNTVLNLTGDVTGSVTFGYDELTLDLETDASGILSDTPEAGKGLKVDSNLDLPR